MIGVLVRRLRRFGTTECRRARCRKTSTKEVMRTAMDIDLVVSSWRQSLTRTNAYSTTGVHLAGLKATVVSAGNVCVERGVTVRVVERGSKVSFFVGVVERVVLVGVRIGVSVSLVVVVVVESLRVLDVGSAASAEGVELEPWS